MSAITSTIDAELAEVAEILGDNDRFVVASHLNPDGDAIGSVRALELALVSLGKDVVTFIPHGALPREFHFIKPDHFTGEVPHDISSRLLVCLDCGNESRVVHPELLEQATRVINIDHHQDNTRFGDVNVVHGERPCTTDLVWQLVGKLGCVDDGGLFRKIATAVYVGLVTDTGKFQYSNTTPEAFALASELVANGVNTYEVYKQIFANLPISRLKLLASGLSATDVHFDGRVLSTYLSIDDFKAAGAHEDDSEGIVDAIRSVEGVCVAVMMRQLAGDDFALKGSLRTTRDDVDVSLMARSWGGGGHRQAAGFTTSDKPEVVVAKVCEFLADQVP